MEGVGQVDVAAMTRGFRRRASRSRDSASRCCFWSAASRPRPFQVCASEGSRAAAAAQGSRAPSSCLTLARFAQISRQTADRGFKGTVTEELDGLGGMTLLEVKNTQTFEGAYCARIECKYLAVAFLSLDELAADMAGLCLAKCVFDAHLIKVPQRTQALRRGRRG